MGTNEHVRRGAQWSRPARYLVGAAAEGAEPPSCAGADPATFRELAIPDTGPLRLPDGLDEAALRYATVLERLLARDEQTTLVVCHEIPVRYAVNAAGGSDELNGPVRSVANATPYLFDEETLARAVERIRELSA